MEIASPETVPLLQRIDWNAVTAVSTALMSLVVLVSVIYIARQLRELQASNYFQAFAHLREMLQAPGLPESRRMVYNSAPGTIDLSSEGNPHAAARNVCRTFDTLGTMVRQRMIPKRMAIDLWGDALVRTYRILGPSLEKYRKQVDRPGLWVNYGWLAGEAERQGILASGVEGTRGPGT